MLVVGGGNKKSPYGTVVQEHIMKLSLGIPKQISETQGSKALRRTHLTHARLSELELAVVYRRICLQKLRLRMPYNDFCSESCARRTK